MPRTGGRGTGPWSQHWSAGPWWKWCFARTWRQRPLLLLAALAVLGPLLWRRTHPLVAVAVSFGTLTIVDIVRILTGSHGALLNSISAALILAYALFRWGSGREAASGLGVILLWLPITTSPTP